MTQQRTAAEDLVFRSAEMDAAMTSSGFRLAHSDPDAARDFSYRARYIRSRSTFFPCLQAYLEYYSAAQAFSLKISTSDEASAQLFSLIVKNHKGSLKDLLDRYFAAVRRGAPLRPDELRS